MEDGARRPQHRCTERSCAQTRCSLGNARLFPRLQYSERSRSLAGGFAQIQAQSGCWCARARLPLLRPQKSGRLDRHETQLGTCHIEWAIRLFGGKNRSADRRGSKSDVEELPLTSERESKKIRAGKPPLSAQHRVAEAQHCAK